MSVALSPAFRRSSGSTWKPSPADMAFRAVVLAIDQPVLGSIPASHDRGRDRPCVVAAEYCAGLPASTDPTQQRPVWFTRKTYEIFAAGRLVRLIDAFAN